MSSRQSLATAARLFFGKASYGPANDSLRGVPCNLLTAINFGAPIVEDADAFIKAATSTELPNATTTTYTFPASNVSPTDSAQRDGVCDVPRNVVATVTHASSIVAMTILVTGTDVYGRVMSELLTITATGTSKTATGAKAFKTITSIAITSAGNATSNTADIGTGKKLGLPYRVDQNGLWGARFGGAHEAGTFVAAVTTDPATTTTGDVRGTYTPAGTLDGSTQVGVLVQIADSQTKVGSYGVAQV